MASPHKLARDAIKANLDRAKQQFKAFAKEAMEHRQRAQHADHQARRCEAEAAELQASYDALLINDGPFQEP